MANKQIGGYGLGVSNEAGEEVKKSPIQNAEEKTQDLINANPNGTTITKFSESINNQLTQYLPMKRLELAELEEIKAQGSGAEGYSEAIDGINAIEKGLKRLNNDFEGAAQNPTLRNGAWPKPLICQVCVNTLVSFDSFVFMLFARFLLVIK